MVKNESTKYSEGNECPGKKGNPDLLILCATLFEIAPFLGLCPGESKKTTRTGITIISGRIKPVDQKPYDPEICNPVTYDLVITGPGVFNAAHALTVYLETSSSPKLILQTGIAGVFRQSGYDIGDVAVATREQYIHTGVQSDGLENDPLPFDLILKDPLTRKGIYPFEKKRVDHYHDRLSRAFSKTRIKIAKGNFVTVSSITSSQTGADQVYRAFSPVMESMEGAASAHIAALYNRSLIEIRSASNFVGERDRSKWDIALAAEQLGRVCALIYPDI